MKDRALYLEIVKILGEAENILDIGCGTGRLTAELLRSGVKVFGLDSSPEMIKYASTKYPENPEESPIFRR